MARPRSHAPAPVPQQADAPSVEEYLPVPKMVKRNPADLTRLEVNARYMTQAQYQRLVDNVRRDGCLTSVPLIWAEPGLPEGRERILSGNHRTDAARDAGLEEIDCMLLDGPLASARRIAVQLSHNAINGQDDAATLAQLYEEIDDVDWRDYAGLDDKTLQLLDKVELQSLSEANLDFATVQLVFLPHERDAATAALEAARLSADSTWLAARRDYEPALDALAAVHAAHNVGNVATAFGIVLSVFEAHLEDLKAGFVDRLGQPLHKGAVGWEAVFASRAVPAADAARVLAAAKACGTALGRDVDAAEWVLLAAERQLSEQDL
ncbi:ParB N-terminal domain-containing protein [Streptacidiphilus cavernicola]|uniref:ParB N-terminal domain-containing protein n=1 Tax=Streptacidiphilus cavernicola TaxID=3342716 RepID=A0ABV6VYB5_9ACTN